MYDMPETLMLRTLSGDHNRVDLLDIRSRLPLGVVSIQAAYLGTFGNNEPEMTEYGHLSTLLTRKTPLKQPILVLF